MCITRMIARSPLFLIPPRFVCISNFELAIPWRVTLTCHTPSSFAYNSSKKSLQKELLLAFYERDKQIKINLEFLPYC